MDDYHSNQFFGSPEQFTFQGYELLISVPRYLYLFELFNLTILHSSEVDEIVFIH